MFYIILVGLYSIKPAHHSDLSQRISWPAPYSSLVRIIDIPLKKTIPVRTTSLTYLALPTCIFLTSADSAHILEKIALSTSLVQFKLDYCNSLSITSTYFKWNVFKQSIARALTTKFPKENHQIPFLIYVLWLKALQRIRYRIVRLSLTYNALETLQPSCIRQLFTIQPFRSTRSPSYLFLGFQFPSLSNSATAP